MNIKEVKLGINGKCRVFYQFDESTFYDEPFDITNEEVVDFIANNPDKVKDIPASEKRTAILNELAKIDSKTIRPLRAILSGEATQEDRDTVISLEIDANRLRTELATI